MESCFCCAKQIGTVEYACVDTNSFVCNDTIYKNKCEREEKNQITRRKKPRNLIHLQNKLLLKQMNNCS